MAPALAMGEPVQGNTSFVGKPPAEARQLATVAEENSQSGGRNDHVPLNCHHRIRQIRELE
jgi:hypothetical protein